MTSKCNGVKLKIMNITDLYNKVSEFESKQTNEFKQALVCKKGCSKCCYVDLSVFELEADNIKNWFSALSKQNQKAIKSKLELTKSEGACSFLRNEECAIYEARPLICRTQGNALFFQEDGINHVDICPLNDEATDVMQNDDVLNLDLLNTILAQMNHSLGYSENRIALNEIAKFIGKFQ